MTTDLPTEETVNAVISAIPTNLPLQEQIDMQVTQAAKYLPEEVAKQLNSHLEYLVTSSIAENALKENELAPDFTLPDALGQHVTLSRLLEQGPVVLVFYRGGWCPYCIACIPEGVVRVQGTGGNAGRNLSNAARPYSLNGGKATTDLPRPLRCGQPGCTPVWAGL